MSEYLKTKGVALGLMLALGCTACSDPESNGQKETQQPAKGGGPVNISIKYYDNGTRITTYHEGDTGLRFAKIISFCDGKYIVDQTDDYDRSGNSIQRTLDPLACADGKLTASDFTLPGTK